MGTESTSERTKLFISKATPGDDAFTLWLATRLEAEGYVVFADILDLDAGDAWRRKITANLQKQSIKMLLCCSDETLQRDGVLEEIEIAKDLTRSLDDPNFIIPLKLKRFEKLFGIASLQYIDFEQSWADGLVKLLKSLERQNVPKQTTPVIQPGWADYQRRRAIKLIAEPEVLTSNWLRIMSVPDDLNLIAPKGMTSIRAMKKLSSEFPYPLIPFGTGFMTFAEPADFEEHFASMGAFERLDSVSFATFSDEGWLEQDIEYFDARRMISNLLRQAWETHVKKQGFHPHDFANGTGHIVTQDQITLNKRVPWGRQGDRRLSVLRNKSKGKVWEYGVSAQPSLFPFPHFRLKGRVLFSEVDAKLHATIIEDHRLQHKFRRSVCGSWRNRAWHGRLMAFMELLAGESPYVSLPVGMGHQVLIDASPIQATSPVTARNTTLLGEDAEEVDDTTLGGRFVEDEA